MRQHRLFSPTHAVLSPGQIGSYECIETPWRGGEDKGYGTANGQSFASVTCSSKERLFGRNEVFPLGRSNTRPRVSPRIAGPLRDHDVRLNGNGLVQNFLVLRLYS